MDTYFRHNIADPLRFTLGGPYRPAASSIDEYRATDDYLVRFGYLHRLASLPTGLGNGIYLVSAYEAGEVWTPENKAFLRQDIFSGFVVDTPLGVMTLGGSLGDAGRRKAVLSIGKLFCQEFPPACQDGMQMREMICSFTATYAPYSPAAAKDRAAAGQFKKRYRHTSVPSAQNVA